MGVCKCKQRNVTNQFCYVCRMNVCESCIVKDHQRCIIKSYVQWLQDSDYNAICLLCMENVNAGEVIRLTCYDLFHWDCFNKWALEHMESTPASKYLCPDCKSPVFPPKALISPVADVVREKFSTVGWGRRCMGLAPEPVQHAKTKVVNEPVQSVSTPIVEIRPLAESTPKAEYKATSDSSQVVKPSLAPVSKPKKQPIHEIKQQVKIPKQQGEEERAAWKEPSPQQPTANAATYVRDKFQSEAAATPHKVIDSRRYDDAKINVSYDIDDNKYKRKGFTHWFVNLLSLNKDKKPSAKKDFSITFKRVTIALILFSIIFVTILYAVSSYGRNFAASDPMLDPMKNPNIHVQDVSLPEENVAGAAALT